MTREHLIENNNTSISPTQTRQKYTQNQTVYVNARNVMCTLESHYDLKEVEVKANSIDNQRWYITKVVPTNEGYFYELVNAPDGKDIKDHSLYIFVHESKLSNIIDVN